MMVSFTIVNKLVLDGLHDAEKAVRNVEKGGTTGSDRGYAWPLTMEGLREQGREAVAYWQSHPFEDYWRGWLMGVGV